MWFSEVYEGYLVSIFTINELQGCLSKANCHSTKSTCDLPPETFVDRAIIGLFVEGFVTCLERLDELLHVVPCLDDGTRSPVRFD